MGAASSVRSVYADAVDWFRQYFDDQTYVTDFHSIDKDHDGGIRYTEFVSWLQKRAASEGGPWLFFISHPEIVATAHLQASKFGVVKSDTFVIEKIVDIGDFRNLLIQLFAVSILWTHFKKADDWQSAHRHDSYDGRLGLEECILGVRSFCAAYGQEELSDEQIRQDFLTIDTDGSGQLTLLEVCTLCSKFVDPGRAETLLLPNSQTIATLNLGGEELAKLKETAQQHYREELAVAETITNPGHEGSTNDVDGGPRERQPVNLAAGPHDAEVALPIGGTEASTEAMSSVLQEVSKNANIAEFIEMKMATEKELDLALLNPMNGIVLDDA